MEVSNQILKIVEQRISKDSELFLLTLIYIVHNLDSILLKEKIIRSVT